MFWSKRESAAVDAANVRSYSFRKLLPLKTQNFERHFCAKK
jgi:hypothetical protein